jgi:hypothetical protein
MKTGALLFAHNNKTYDYIKLAKWTAGNIHRHLDLPVTLITDHDAQVSDGIFDMVIRIDPGAGSLRYFNDTNSSDYWYNDSRVQSYDLSPYDRTLVLDSDYVVASPVLRLPMVSHVEFLCHKRANAVGIIGDWNANYFGQNRFPMAWATVMIFSKTPSVKFIFESMKMVQQNWQHYKNLYQVGKMHYRNDYALSVALGLYTGHSQIFHAIPWNLVTVLPEHTIESSDTLDKYKIKYKNQEGKPKWVDINYKDFHAMCKNSLGELIETDRRTRLFNSCLQ